jgi:hypothetical protein
MRLNGTTYHPNLLLIPGMSLLIILILLAVSEPPVNINAIFLLSFLPGIDILVVFIDIIRLRRHIKKNGDKLTSIKWAPFGPGWLSWLTFTFGRKYFSIYKVGIVDSKGRSSEAYVRVSLFYGIRFTG